MIAPESSRLLVYGFPVGCLLFHDLRADVIRAGLLIPWAIDVTVHRILWETPMGVVNVRGGHGHVLLYVSSESEIMNVPPNDLLTALLYYYSIILHYCATALLP